MADVEIHRMKSAAESLHSSYGALLRSEVLVIARNVALRTAPESVSVSLVVIGLSPGEEKYRLATFHGGIDTVDPQRELNDPSSVVRRAIAEQRSLLSVLRTVRNGSVATFHLVFADLTTVEGVVDLGDPRRGIRTLHPSSFARLDSAPLADVIVDRVLEFPIDLRVLERMTNLLSALTADPDDPLERLMRS